jgi:transglutaminase-like putative cysteine protease
MHPGDISRLIQSDELAFRAEFKARQPTPQQLYWRGPVLWDYDGRTWLTHTPPDFVPLHAAGLGEPLTYRLILEPQRQPWLLLLGLPKRLPPLPGSHLGPDLQWQSDKPIDQRLQYEVEAWPDYRLQADTPPGPRALALPAEGDPQARELARQWQAQSANDAAIVARALTLFRQEPFHYTLAPPPLGLNAVDGFLFASRRGFCEHYAGSFVFLMRAAGVPARVVTGYQGGEKNPLGGHYVIRGRDAHAWAEVWLAGQGWVRVDPTAAVAPSRVERGIAGALPAHERIGGFVDAGWLMPLRLTWDLVNNQWNVWVLGYDDDRQRRLLERLDRKSVV